MDEFDKSRGYFLSSPPLLYAIPIIMMIMMIQIIMIIMIMIIIIMMMKIIIYIIKEKPEQATLKGTISHVGQEKRKDRKSRKSSSEQKVLGFSSASLFPQGNRRQAP